MIVNGFWQGLKTWVVFTDLDKDKYQKIQKTLINNHFGLLIASDEDINPTWIREFFDDEPGELESWKANFSGLCQMFGGEFKEFIEPAPEPIGLQEQINALQREVIELKKLDAIASKELQQLELQLSKLR